MRYRESIRGARWMRIRDSIAERLEACGLYRRAASRWIEVMQRCLDDEDREWIRHHRNQCPEKGATSAGAERGVCRPPPGAKETQYRMGIAKPYGEAFRAARQRENGRRVMPFFTTFALTASPYPAYGSSTGSNSVGPRKRSAAGRYTSDAVPAVVPDGGINALSGLRVLSQAQTA
ncbi:PerC transcriptional activator [Klebsiella pneumoniae]|nr:PerC transcriptional activator [Klebsiella pneumoniae]